MTPAAAGSGDQPPKSKPAPDSDSQKLTARVPWTDADDKKLRHARTFGTDEFDDLVEEAIKALKGEYDD